jgi:hypothetical protein
LATQIELSLTGCEGAVESNPQPLLTLEFESQPSIKTLGLSLANGKAEHAAAGDDGDDRDVARQDQALAEGARSPSSAECHSADTYGRVVRVDLDTEAKSLGETKHWLVLAQHEPFHFPYPSAFRLVDEPSHERSRKARSVEAGGDGDRELAAGAVAAEDRNGASDDVDPVRCRDRGHDADSVLGKRGERATQTIQVRFANDAHETHVAGFVAHALERLQKFGLIGRAGGTHMHHSPIAQRDITLKA